ncbi:hypothetical protein BDY19DRAFT_881625 [Irpex rosettiformis]|uniref:Uncharacterized protein n=1 Tax=Irpex rosettiformis TaxID=378272 RepID=A0ACB8UHE0_9APHY|nr:hypothetical protein BDY19DRAFT_881625 [Irpex rosettiformis]
MALTGWHTRTTPYPSPATFTPTRASLAFAVLRNAQADPEGFTLALFSPDLAVDARGKVLLLQKTDWDGLVGLAGETVDLPKTGKFWNAWKVRQERTSQPIDRLLVATSESGELVETSVQGWEKGKTELSEPVGEIAQLPPVLDELVGLVREGREGYVKGEEDKIVIGKIKDVLGVE